jgi:hypothetical protein
MAEKRAILDSRASARLWRTWMATVVSMSLSQDGYEHDTRRQGRLGVYLNHK